MFCDGCGQHLRDGNQFCPHCGTPVSHNLEIIEEHDVAVLRWKADAIAYTTHGEFGRAFPKIHKRYILIDLTGVEFIDSVGIGTLVTMYYKTVHSKQEIKVTGVHPNVLRSIKALKVDNVLDIYPTKEKAFASWGIPTG
jgi:anti-anti-sigma factor